MNRNASKTRYAIRPAEREDAAAVARFIIMAEGGATISFLTGCDDGTAAAEKLAGWILSEIPNRYSPENTLVAEIDGIAVGGAISFPADQQPELDKLILEDVRSRGRDLDALFFEGVPGTYYLLAMGVAPECRARGIGAALMRTAENRAKAQGFRRTSLLVDKTKLRAKALYESMGHATVGEVRLGNSEYWRMTHEL